MDSKEQRYLEARLTDAIRQCSLLNKPRFVGFLDAAGAALAVTIANREKARYKLFGGYEAAERVYFGVFPDWCDNLEDLFPIVKLKIIYRKGRVLEHRDILGALMSAGIERDTVGDILTKAEEPVVFVSNTVEKHITAHIDKIASCGVTIVKDASLYVPSPSDFLELSGTVASLRLDCVVAEVSNCSRNKAAELIESGMVSLNGLEMLKLTANVVNGDTLAVRRVGKFIIDSTDHITKKKRIALKYRKYN